MPLATNTNRSGFRRAGDRSTDAGRLFLLIAAIALAALSTPLQLSAQSETTRIVGRVVDGESGRGLVGALVSVAGRSTGSLSGLDGRYVVNDVPRGRTSLTITYIGYAPKTILDVEVPGDGALSLDVALIPAAVALAGVTVTVAGERGTVSRALDEQRNAVGVTSAITAAQIARSPDGDAAAAVQRVSGVTVQEGKFVFVRGLGERYTSTSLNGSRVPSPEPERRMVPLDLFPAGLLQAITTSKTFTPDLQGDFSGALVDIRTREYPVGRILSFSMSQGYNSAVMGSTLPMAPTAGGEWLAAATAPRLIPDVVRNTPRPQPGSQTNAMVNAMRNVWSAQDRSGRLSSSLGASLGGSEDFLGRNLGYLLSATYSLGDEVNLGTVRENVEGDRYEGTVGRQSAMLGGLLNLSTMLGTNSRVVLNNSYNRTADNEARVETGFYENHHTNIQIERLRYVERTVRSSQLQGQHQLGERQRLEWTLNSAGVSRQEPDRSEFVIWLDPVVPTWYNQEGAFRAYGGLTENSLEASADYRIDLDTAGDRVIRFGVLARGTDRDAYDTGFAIRSRDWTPTDPRWQLEPESFFDGRFAGDGDALFEMGIFNAGGSYTAEDRLAATYSMVEWGVTQRIRLVAGARIERNELALGYEDVLGTRGVSETSYTDLLPAIAINIDLTDNQKLRLSGSRTLARPEYREIAPICYRAGLGEEQRCGNPDLVRTLIRNFDVRWEQYPRIGELLAIALFAKQFEKPIEPRYQGRSGTNSLWFQNADRAVNYGVELEAMRTLDFLGDRFAPLSAFANATVMRSEVHTGIEGDPRRRMTGQAPYVLNGGLTWAPDGGSTSATILFNVVGERIVNARPSGQSVQDVLEMPRPGLDLSLRFPVFGTVAGKLDVKNILDSPYELRQGELVRAYHTSGRTVSMGFSWSR